MKFEQMNHLLSSLVALVEHVVKHYWLPRLEGVHCKTLDKVLFGEPFLASIWLTLVMLRNRLRRHHELFLKVVLDLN